MWFSNILYIDINGLQIILKSSNMWFGNMLYINVNCFKIILKLTHKWFGNKLNVFNINIEIYFYRKFKIMMMMVNFD